MPYKNKPNIEIGKFQYRIDSCLSKNPNFIFGN